MLKRNKEGLGITKIDKLIKKINLLEKRLKKVEKVAHEQGVLAETRHQDPLNWPGERRICGPIPLEDRLSLLLCGAKRINKAS
jgi:hypothetical protein